MGTHWRNASTSDNCFHEGLHAETVRGKVLADSIHVPKTVNDALSGMQSAEWRASVAKENKPIRDNDVMRLIPRSQVPIGRKILRAKYICVSREK